MAATISAEVFDDEEGASWVVIVRRVSL